MGKIKLELESPVYCFIELDCNSIFTPANWKSRLREIKPYILKIILQVKGPFYPRLIGQILEINSMKIRFDLELKGQWPDMSQLIDSLSASAYFENLIFFIHSLKPDSNSLLSGSMDVDLLRTHIKNALGSGLSVCINTILGNHNKNEIEDLVEFSSELKIKKHIFARYTGPLREKISLYRDDLRKLIKKIIMLKEKRPYAELSGCFPQCFCLSNSRCLAGIAFLAIDSQGNVKPCSFTSEIIDNIRIKPLKKIWSSEKMRAYRENLPIECAECHLLPECHGGCRAMISLYGLRKDPLLDTSFLNHNKNDQAGRIEKALDSDRNYVIYPRYVSRYETFGMTLLYQGKVIPVSKKGIAVIKSIEKKPSIAEFKNNMREESLNFLFTLQKYGFVEIIEKEIDPERGGVK